MICLSPRATIHSEIYLSSESDPPCLFWEYIGESKTSSCFQLNSIFWDTKILRSTWEPRTVLNKLGSVCVTSCNYFGGGRQGAGIGQFGIGGSWGSKDGGRTAWKVNKFSSDTEHGSYLGSQVIQRLDAEESILKPKHHKEPALSFSLWQRTTLPQPLRKALYPVLCFLSVN